MTRGTIRVLCTYVTSIEPSGDDERAHLLLDHPHLPHREERRFARAVGEFTLRTRHAGTSRSWVSVTAEEPRLPWAGVAARSETRRKCRLSAREIHGWTDNLHRRAGLAGGPTVAAGFRGEMTATLSLDSALQLPRSNTGADSFRRRAGCCPAREGGRVFVRSLAPASHSQPDARLRLDS